MIPFLKKYAIYIIVFCLVMTGITTIKATSEEKKEAEALRIAKKAYIYGYPLVLMDATKQFTTNVVSPDEKGAAPLNQMGHELNIPSTQWKGVVSPNLDTLYSAAFLDLSKEPLVFHVPDTKGRYYLTPILDAWSNVVTSLGKRTTGTKAQDFIITGPDWKHPLPKDLPVIQLPTNMGWIVGRVQWNGPQDTTFVNEIQKQFSLTPLSRYGKPYSPPKGNVNPNIDMSLSPPAQVNRLSAEAFFNRLALLLKQNPPSPADGPITKEMAKIGIIPGKPFNVQTLNPQVRKGVMRSPSLARKEMNEAGPKVQSRMGSWSVDFKGGTYGTNYLRRGFTAVKIFAENLAADALYAVATTDNTGQVLNGTHKYVLHFNKNQLPLPVNGFWSVTVYDNEQFLVANPIHRFTLGDRSNLKINPDGSLDIYIQTTSPGKEKESNWLPSPEGNFNLILRMYWPKKEVLDQKWPFPVVKKAS